MKNQNYKWYKLKTPSFIDPRLLRSLPSLGIYSDGLVYLKNNESIIFRLEESDHDLLNGEEVKINVVGGFLHCKSTYQIKKEEEFLLEKAKVEKENQIHKKELTKRQNIEFNHSLNIPFKWSVAQKDVLSGLSDKSSGDGTNARTVNHILVKEKFIKGKLSRDIGEFLCSRKSGKNWSAQIEVDYHYRVSCKKCLEIIERLIKREG